MEGLATEYLIGVFTNLIGPHVGWSTSITMSRARTRLAGVRSRYRSTARLC